MIRRVVFGTIVLLLLTVSAIIVIAFARGYRFNINDGSLEPTGILNATSEPDGAAVYVDGILAGATDTNINLPPKWYTVKLEKDGYHAWERNMRVQGEVVRTTNATLFLKNPSLFPLISTGVVNPMLSPDGTQIAYIASPSATTPRGQSVYELQLTRPTLFIYDFESQSLPFSKNPHPYEGTLDQLLEEWKLEEKTLRALQLRKMPDEFLEVATNSVEILSFSPDGQKVLYEATASASLKRSINPPIIGGFSTEEARTLEPGALYVYDAKEDRNYLLDISSGDKIGSAHNSLQWLGNSEHLVITEGNKITVMEHDGGNKTVVYSGPFENSYVFSHPSGHQLVVMINLNPEIEPTASLYMLTIR